jgi:GT2 family glycosyltransferase
MARRTSGQWAHRTGPLRPKVDVLVPTCDRPAELAVTLAGLAAQDRPAFAVRISDQSHGSADWEHPAVQAMVRVLRAQGRAVTTSRHLPRRGMAEQRSYLLGLATAPQVLFLDNDVWLEPGALERLSEALMSLACGFVGMAVQGLSHLDEHRPAEEATFEPWRAKVRPERVRRSTASFQRWPLHNAANITHLAERHAPDAPGWLAYRVAWVGGCVLFDRAALIESGGFDFWSDLPADHAGEDVAAQWRVMEARGGAGVLPSGAVHLESPTTVKERRVDATDILFRDSPPAPMQ